MKRNYYRSDEVKIEKGIPIPFGADGDFNGGATKYPWREMEIGDSFLFKFKNKSSVATQAIVAGRKLGRKFSYRTISKGVARVWRVPGKETALRTVQNLKIPSQKTFKSISDRASDSGLLNTRDAAKILGLSPGTLPIWRCKKRYKLPYIKVGGIVRYRMSDIQTFLELRTRRIA